MGFLCSRGFSQSITETQAKYGTPHDVANNIATYTPGSTAKQRRKVTRHTPFGDDEYSSKGWRRR